MWRRANILNTAGESGETELFKCIFGCLMHPRASLKLPSSLPTLLINLEDLYHQASAKYILYYSSSLQENIASLLTFI